MGRPSRKIPVRSSTGWHTPAKEIIETLALIAEGGRVSSLSRVKGYKEETIRNWLQQAAEHVERVEDVLMQEYEIGRGQLDGLWSYIGHKRRAQGPRRAGKGGKKEPSDDAKGVYWRSTMVETDTRLRVGRGIGKTETEASEEVFRTLKRTRSHPGKASPTVSDGGGGMRKAMVQVWGEVPEEAVAERPRSSVGKEAPSGRLGISASDQSASDQGAG